MTTATVGWARALATVAAVVAVDQVTKHFVRTSLELGQDVRVIPGVLELTSTRNRGVAFGALEGQGVAVAVLIGFALLLLLGYFSLHASKPLVWLPVGMLLGGALGNLLDRARHGAVIDFVDFVAWPSFNLADATIVLAVPLLLLSAERRTRDPDAVADAPR